MAWTIVAIVLLAAVGPLLWLLPSRRQRQQAEWRIAARRHGLAVELAAVENPDAPAQERVSSAGEPLVAERRCVAYRLPLVPPLSDGPRWRLVKSEREPRCLAGWLAPTPPVGVPTPAADYWRQLGPLIDALPGGCIAVEATARAVSWFGLESGGEDDAAATVAAIAAGLGAIAALHRQTEHGGAYDKA